MAANRIEYSKQRFVIQFLVAKKYKPCEIYRRNFVLRAVKHVLVNKPLQTG